MKLSKSVRCYAVSLAVIFLSMLAVAAVPVYNVTVGSQFEISVDDLPGIEQLDKKPKVYISGGDLGTKKKSIKVLTKTYSAKTLECEMKAKVPTGKYTLYLIPKIKGEKPDPIPVTEDFNVIPLRIDTMTPEVGETDVEVTLTGKYFGVKKPKLWMEYEEEKKGKTKTKKAKCKVLKPLEYIDGKGKFGKSCMDVKTGDSKLRFLVPKKITRDIKCRLFIDNKISHDQKTFNSDTFSIAGTVSGDIKPV